MKRKRLGVLIVFMMAVLSFTFNTFGEEGVTDTEIHIGQWGPQTGPAAPWGAVARGSDAFFKMINEEGGIHGRKIVYHYFDDAYNPAKTKAGVKQLQESDHSIFAWVGGVGSAPGMAVKDYLMNLKVPWIAPSAGSLVWVDPPQKYLFPVYPLYIIEAKALVTYAVKTLGKKRVAIVYQNDEYGTNGMKGAKAQLAEYNMELVAAIPQNLADTDLKPHVQQLIKADADTVLLWMGPGGAARTLGTAKQMQYDPQFMNSSTLSDYPLMFSITRGLWKGVITASFGLPPESEEPLMVKYKTQAFEKFSAKGERWGSFYGAGFGYAEPLVEALKRTGRNLTRERLVHELEQMKNFQGIMGKISFKPFDPNDIYSRQGQTEVFLAKCGDDGKVIILSDWIKPTYNPAKEK
ncbi:ABC transporter substrate-binding protein [bacterium]|nr:ABC transporter substrate-binding protein [bacterium]